MLVNSAGDWMVYGLGLGIVVYWLARALPGALVSCTLHIYRAYRRARVGIQQIRGELPLGDEGAKDLQVIPQWLKETS